MGEYVHHSDNLPAGSDGVADDLDESANGFLTCTTSEPSDSRLGQLFMPSNQELSSPNMEAMQSSEVPRQEPKVGAKRAADSR